MLKICFIGNIEFSWHVLDEIRRRRYPVQAVFQAESRDGISDYASTKRLAMDCGAPYQTFKNINDIESVLRELQPDVVLLCGASQIVKPAVLAIPKMGWIGTHPALLPKNRGRASIPWSILNKDREGGLSFFMLGEKVDSGDVLFQQKWDIGKNDTAATLYWKMIMAGREGIAFLLKGYFEEGKFPPRSPQDNSIATYTTRRTPEDGLISWDRMDGEEIDRLIRATTYPYPGAFSYLRGVKVVFWKARFESFPHPIKPNGEIISSTNDLVIIVKGGILTATVFDAPSSLTFQDGDRFSEAK